MKIRIGQGFDTHNIINEAGGKPLIIGGVTVSKDSCVIAHSDGDVLTHALIDSILGALSLGDIGEWFSDKKAIYRNISSDILLKEVLIKTEYQKKWIIINLDSTVVLETPKLGNTKVEIKSNVAKLLNLEEDRVSIKAKTFENKKQQQIWCYTSLLIELMD